MAPCSLSFYTLQTDSHWRALFQNWPLREGTSQQRMLFPTQLPLSLWQFLLILADRRKYPSWRVPQGASKHVESKVPLTLSFPEWLWQAPWPRCSAAPLGLGRVQMAEKMWPCYQDSCACRTCSDKKENHPVSWGSRHLPMEDDMSLRNSLFLAPQSQIQILASQNWSVPNTKTRSYVHRVAVSPWHCASLHDEWLT